MTSPSHAGQHSDANDAIEVLEAKVGVDGSAVTTSLDYKLKSSSSVDPGHQHTIVKHKVASKTANYTAASEMVILCNATSGNITITLPAAASWSKTSPLVLALTKADAVRLFSQGKLVQLCSLGVTQIPVGRPTAGRLRHVRSCLATHCRLPRLRHRSDSEQEDGRNP
jgi:hypothetical protein